MQFNQVCKAFGEQAILTDFSHHFDTGKHCIVGENGCGKTTLLMLAAGLETCDSGDIHLQDLKVDGLAAKSKIGISSDKIIFPRFLSAGQLLEFHCRSHKVELPKTLINDLHFRAHLGTLVPDLSLGNQKKLSLLMALAHHPECLLLDEPSTGLDSYSREYMLDFLQRFEGLLIITSHDPVFIDNPDYQILKLAPR